MDEWVGYYNTGRPHQAIGDATPAEKFSLAGAPAEVTVDSSDQPARPAVGRGGSQGRREPASATASIRDSDGWISRKVGANGVVCVNWQQVSVGKHRAGQRCDVLVGEQLLQFWIGDQLMKTVTRTSSGEVRQKHAQGSRAQG